MRVVDRAPSWAFAAAVKAGFGLICFATVSGSSWATLISLMGLWLAGKSAIILDSRSGVTDQPQ
jgi:hypothetical protein